MQRPTFILVLSCVFVCVTSVVWSQDQSKTLDAQRAQAGAALSAGDAATSARLAAGVVALRTNDAQAFYLLSLAQMQLGQHKSAAQSAGQAFKYATTAENKVEAARVAAAAKFQLRRYTQAEWWIRRGLNHTESADQVAQLQQEFRAIRAQNPLTVRAGFSVAPSNNINGGTEDATFALGNFQFVFNPTSRSLSGVEYSADLDVRYRLAQSPNAMTEVGVYAYGRTYSLSSSSKAAAPGVSGADFALGLVEVSLSHQRLLFPKLGPSGITLHQGQVWSGGDPVWRYQKLSLSQGIAINSNASAAVFASVEEQTGLRPSQPDARVTFAQGSYANRLGNGDVVRLAVNRRFHNSERATNTFTDHRVTVGYELARPVFGTELSFSATVGRKKYDEFSISLDGRRDRYVSLGATAVLNQVSYYGFSPSWTVSATRTKSNVSRFSTREVTGRVGIQSNF